jgi:3-phenylpropionate/trans-cinnamate dioxygenase ferredoxin reductase subunit
MTAGRHVLVGGGVAAAATATHLRKLGYEGQIVLVCEEPDAPYERPPLSKDFLVGDTAEGEFVAHPAGWYAEQDITLRLGVRAEDIDIAARTVRLSTGEPLGYDELVLATGVRPRRLPVADGLAGVHYLRTLADARALREGLAGAQRIVVLGAGFVGCEVAAAAVRLGKQVTVFEPEPTPLRRVLGEAIGAVVLGIHQERGVVIRAGEYVTEAVHTAAGLQLSTNLGGRVDCDLLVVGVGSLPNTELAERAGIAVDNGILVDEFGRTAVPHVHAAGDVARQYHPHVGERVRVEHHDTAQRQGAALAANLTGAAKPFTDPYWFWSDQYEHSLQSAGRVGDPADLIFRGSLQERSFAAFTLDGDRIRGVVALNRPRDVIDVRRLLSTPHTVTADQLRDETVRLKRLVTQGQPTRRGA